MKIAFNPSTVAALTTPPNNKDITFDLRGHSIFARGVEFKGTDTNTWRDIKINNVSIGSHTLDLRNGSNTTLTNTNGVVTINSTWRPVVDNLTSDSTTSSLSAKQGKVLKALIDGKSNSDHNHDGRYAISENYGGFKKSGRLPISGFYQSDESESGGNAPWSNWMHLINCQHTNTDNNYALQIAASFFDNNTFKIRVTNNNVNNSWRNIIHSGNISSQSVNYANSAGNADTVDGAHLSDIKNWSDRTASAYWKAGWYKVASAQTATNTEAFLTLDVNAAQSNGHATLFIRKRADSKPYFICTHNNNLNLADFRLYYNGMSMVLYARVPNDWNGRVFRIISEGREGTYDHIWTLYSSVSSTDPNAISAEGGNPYINPTYSGRVDWSNSSDKANYANSAGSVAWANVTGKPSSYTPSAHTHAWNSLTHSSTTENQAILTNGKANGWKLQTLNIARWDNAANNAHSHANKSVLDGITSALVNSWNTAYNFVSNITGTDTDKVINKWEEIVNFLAGITEDNKLNTLLNSKLSVYELADNTNVGTIKNNGIYYSTTDASSGTLINSPFNTGFAFINMTSYDRGNDLRRSRLAFNAFGEIKVSDDRDQANTAETWYNVLTSKNSGINGSTIKLNGTSITVYSSGTADGRYVKKSGDTMSGVLTIDTTNFGALTIKRNDDANGASIQFRGKSSVYGYIGLNNSTKDKQFLRWSSDISRIYTILDTSSTYISNGKGVINGTTITQVDNATNSTNSTNARKLVNWYSARPTSLNAQFGDGSLRIFYATSSTTEGKPAEDSHILHLAWDNTGGYDAQLAVHIRSGKVSTRAQKDGPWQPWKTLAFTTDIPTSLKNPYSFNVFGVAYDGSAAKTVTTSTFVSQLPEGTSTVTDGTMFITSWASNSGFADTNAVNVPYKRKAIYLWEYIKAKTDSLYATNGHNHDGRYVRAFGTSNDNINSDWGQSFKTFDPIPSGTPPEQNPNISILNIGENFNRRKQLAFIWNNDNIYYRRHTDSGFTNWRRLAFANEIPTSLPANGGNADTVDNEHASNFSYTHQTSFDFSKRKSGRIVTFDQSNTDYGWINGFASTHNNYLTSVIFNTHRTSNWYVGYMEGNKSTGETKGLQAVHKLAFADGDESYPIFLGYLNLFNGNDGTISSSFPCLGYSVPFTYTRGGAYCLINIPNTSFQTFYIKAAIASVHYSGAGMGHWVGNHRGDGAWWLHCAAVGSNAVQVEGFRLANTHNDSWWGGNPLYSGDGAAKIITVCLFGHVKYK